MLELCNEYFGNCLRNHCISKDNNETVITINSTVQYIGTPDSGKEAMNINIPCEQFMGTLKPFVSANWTVSVPVLCHTSSS